ncbi:hypothetical protein [Chelatococcus asaccharovorans]|uniref:Uncharacterized protein n=1 Tax=Chelatococcus asaccharovorans TaxID=28210 RepID=A0A2V3UBP6_9HYPH|nr:hypothetical protein [Chelatococcus asaccharovorans]MBS7704352.1 hypothetical protein [Chelatococcus asaccharovorans]PXW55770.1 hypothetical protein C7450_109179 [Chelatococcus asaccharovorans]
MAKPTRRVLEAEGERPPIWNCPVGWPAAARIAFNDTPAAAGSAAQARLRCDGERSRPRHQLSGRTIFAGFSEY